MSEPATTVMDAIHARTVGLIAQGATMRIESGGHVAEMPWVSAGPASPTAHAMQRLDRAKRQLARVKDTAYCCVHSQNQAIGAAKKDIKRWEGWIADAEILRAGGQQTSFLDDEEGDDDDE